MIEPALPIRRQECYRTPIENEFFGLTTAPPSGWQTTTLAALVGPQKVVAE
jgi:hypothetical protein